MTTRIVAAAFLLAEILIAPAAVRAHAFLDHTDPAVGSTVPTAPPEMHLWFTQELEPAFTWVTVSDKSGASMNDGPATVDSSNKQEMDVKLKPLQAGTYTVKWHALSVDTHTTEGDFTFQVKKG
ncbi:MAG TPA: copper resistance CopC family protein [Candidatus Acidoferrales bacterium]|jgi:methionine-rich copper-binding protein CopC|nr:copper resistance CopC family protein [Candidatus Acidoferrales bacterium]